MIYLEFLITGRPDPIRRTWPVVPEVGSTIFFEEVVADVVARKVIFNAVFDGPLIVDGRCAVTVLCDFTPDAEERTSLEDEGVPPVEAKLKIARTALYTLKLALEQGEDEATMLQTIVAALDLTRTKEEGGE